MVQAKCIEKFRDKHNNIYGYRLQDQQGNTKDVKSEELKQAIRNKQLVVINLTLTSDNRLIDKATENNKKSSIRTITNSNQFTELAIEAIKYIIKSSAKAGKLDYKLNAEAIKNEVNTLIKEYKENDCKLYSYIDTPILKYLFNSLPIDDGFGFWNVELYHLIDSLIDYYFKCTEMYAIWSTFQSTRVYIKSNVGHVITCYDEFDSLEGMICLFELYGVDPISEGKQVIIIDTEYDDYLAEETTI